MATQKKTDSPKVHASLTKLRKESPAAAEPFQIALEDSHVITFPDPFAMDVDAAERMFALPDTQVKAALREWLSEEDFTALFRVKRSLRDLMLISQAAQAHFEATYGPVGEDSASRA